MNIRINHKIIKEMCGSVSFKKGDTFYRAGNVTIESYESSECRAIVKGLEDFHVTIQKNANGGLSTTCTCPKLSSYQKKCQHIAAVLLAIYDRQRQGNLIQGQFGITPNQNLTEGLLNLFDHQEVKSSAYQRHFESRELLDILFTCKPILVKENQYLLGIELKIGKANVQDIYDFLGKVKDRKTCLISIAFTYDPNLHCFQTEADAIVQELIQVMENQKWTEQKEYQHNQQLLPIPPSSWSRVFPLLVSAPFVKLENGGNIYSGITIPEAKLPIKFHITEDDGSKYKLDVKGLNQLIILHSYYSVLYKGMLVQLDKDDCQRLSKLKQMLDISGTDQIFIPMKQAEFFLEKVVPGLKKLGEVTISETITKQLKKVPLVAKLYLDRVNNRLLAGLEFQYDHIIFNPLDSRANGAISSLIRDMEKENAIMKLMEESSFTKTEEGYYLHNEELEYQFLYHFVPKIQKFIQVYATTAVRNRISKGNAHPKISIKVKRERTNWLEFKFEMDGIPEKQIRDILFALEEKRKYYRLRNGSLLSLETREFEEIKSFLKGLPNQHEDLVNGFATPIVNGFRLMGLVEDEQVFTFRKSFRQFLDTITKPDKMEINIPKNLEPVLRDYQVHGFKWMKVLANYGFGGILADDMGLGKTLQSITFISSVLPDIRQRKLPTLIVCPSSLTYNWLSEIMKFTSEIQAVVIDGKQSDRLKILNDISDVDVIITSYPILRRDINWYVKHTFHTVFFDEAQSFKNPLTQTARAVKKINADHYFALTGTPIENSLEELWSVFHVVFPELFKGLKEYSNLSRKTIARRTKPFLLRRLKEDVAKELPNKIGSVEFVELRQDQKKLYAAYLAKLRHDTFKHLNKETIRKNRIRILAGLTRLRQICCHPALFVDGYKGSSAKFNQLLKIIEESKLSGRRILIFSQFTKMLELIGKELAIDNLSFFYLDGQTPIEERLQICNRFNAGERDLFLISLKAGGTGLNLTGADTVILYDIWWNPAAEAQAADRAYRIGQTNDVRVLKLVSKGTIEEKMNELQEKKRQLIDEIIQPDGSTPQSLTEEDIREILLF